MSLVAGAWVAAGEPRLVVLYDRDCAFCAWTARQLWTLDRHRRLAFLPLQDALTSRRPDVAAAVAGRSLEEALHVVDERDGRSIVIMDSARWVDPRNTGKDVVVPASYIGVLPARMVAIHRPRGVIGHDACVGKDGAGIAGLWYLEALGIPAATADGMSAEMGNGADLYENGVISQFNYPAERCGVRVYKPLDEKGTKWSRQIVDDGEINVEDLAAVDLDGDGKIDIVAVGRQSHNARIYWNKGR